MKYVTSSQLSYQAGIEADTSVEFTQGFGRLES